MGDFICLNCKEYHASEPDKCQCGRSTFQQIEEEVVTNWTSFQYPVGHVVYIKEGRRKIQYANMGNNKAIKLDELMEFFNLCDGYNKTQYDLTDVYHRGVIKFRIIKPNGSIAHEKTFNIKEIHSICH